MSFQTGEGPLFERLASLYPKSVDLSLDRLLRLLDRLGNPHLHLPPVMHVAGTNGKGSTVAYCRAILEAAGKRVHVYTSPHLVRFNERIRLAGQLVSDDELDTALRQCERVNAGDPITFFEITTAAAFALFAQHAADAVVLETGMGGRLDATNVIPQPALTLLTALSMDHQDYLGTTLAAIAAEKAGIMKKNTPCFSVSPPEDARVVLEKQARVVRAPLFVEGEHFSCTVENGRLLYQDDTGLLDLPLPRLRGRHQCQNAGLAIAGLRHLDPHLSVPVLETGLHSVRWPARLQRLSGGPLVTRAPADAEIWLDGGHNAAAGEVLAEFMADREDVSPRPLILICAMLNTKDAVAFLAPFADLTLKVLCVPLPGVDGAYTPAALSDLAKLAGHDAAAMPDLATALAASAAVADKPRLLICGSLYLAGQALKENGAVLD